MLSLGDQAFDTGTGVKSPCLSLFICKTEISIIPSQDCFENLMGCCNFILIKTIPAAND